MFVPAEKLSSQVARWLEITVELKYTLGYRMVPNTEMSIDPALVALKTVE